MIYLRLKNYLFLFMKNRLRTYILLCILFNSLALKSLNAQTSEMIRPVHRSLMLSGNFGELRATHFHAGIDIRTGGVEGLPVVSVKDGQLVRVRVSPVGYGRALYIDHLDGTTTVYGHLQEFCPRVSEAVRRIQYSKESFDINEDLKSCGIFFRQGDTIAWSGNSGSSGGPHLHFEVRDTKTENILNPLFYYKIRDVIPPKIKALYFYRIADDGCVMLLRRCNVKMSRPDLYTCETQALPAGNIGIAVFAEDYMNDSSNKLGLYRLELMSGADTLFSWRMDACSFDQSCFINEMKDFDCYKKRETVYRCFGNYQHQVLGVKNKDAGQILLKKDSLVNVKLRLGDINGNHSEIKIRLKGGAGKSEDKHREVVEYEQGHSLEGLGFCLTLEPGSLYSSVPKTHRSEIDSLSGSPVIVLSEKDVPLLKKGDLFLSGNFSPRTVICELDGKGRKYPVATSRVSGGLSAKIGYLSRYTTVEDSVAPIITYLGISSDRHLRFKIKDNLTGIADYRGEVNGNWCLFVYDAKNDLFSCSLAEPVFEAGHMNTVKITAGDAVGNRNELEVRIKR